MFGLNPYNQESHFTPFGGGFQQQQGHLPFSPPQQRAPSFFNQSLFSNQNSFTQGRPPFLNNNGTKMGLGHLMNTAGHVMNGYNMLRMLGPMMQYF